MSPTPRNRPAPDRWPVLVFAAIVLAAALVAVAYYGVRQERPEKRIPVAPRPAEREREAVPEFAPEMAPRAAPRAFAARETIRVAFWNVRDPSVGSRDQDEGEIIADTLDERGGGVGVSRKVTGRSDGTDWRSWGSSIF